MCEQVAKYHWKIMELFKSVNTNITTCDKLPMLFCSHFEISVKQMLRLEPADNHMINKECS